MSWAEKVPPYPHLSKDEAIANFISVNVQPEIDLLQNEILEVLLRYRKENEKLRELADIFWKWHAGCQDCEESENGVFCSRLRCKWYQEAVDMSKELGIEVADEYTFEV